MCGLLDNNLGGVGGVACRSYRYVETGGKAGYGYPERFGGCALGEIDGSTGAVKEGHTDYRFRTSESGDIAC